jgi:hypothetical protein
MDFALFLWLTANSKFQQERHNNERSTSNMAFYPIVLWNQDPNWRNERMG